MRYKPVSRKEMNHPKTAPILTTIMELLYALSELTKDDRVVLSAFKSIFQSYNVRLAHSLVLVRLVGDNAPSRSHTGTTSEKRRPADIARLSIIEKCIPPRISEKKFIEQQTKI